MRIAFVMEMGLGHSTVYQNMQSAVRSVPEIEATWIPITFDSDFLGRVPKIRHDIVLRGGVQASSKLRAALKHGRYDALFFHTQMPSVFCHDLMRRIPTAISLDATPKQFLELGPHYGMVGGPETPLERRRDRWYRRAFQASRYLFTFSQWAADSAVGDYGVPAACVKVFRQGVDLSTWSPPPAKQDSGQIQLLFVGNDLHRKGGDMVMDWMQRSPPRFHLDVVTRDPVTPMPRVTVHSDLKADDPRLLSLYQQADLFVLPTHADCAPNVLIEAMAAGLPVLSTRVAAIPEMVEAGPCAPAGRLIPAGDPEAFASTIEQMCSDTHTLRKVGVAARARAEAMYDRTQTLALEINTLREMASQRQAG